VLLYLNLGKITDFKVMIRPPKGALLVKKHMDIRVGKFLKKMAEKAAKAQKEKE